MPFYEYQCSACGHHHEELQKITDGPLRKCPACGRSTLKRLVSAPVFRLKGGGWYETDFKGDKDSQRNLAGEKEPAAAETLAVIKEAFANGVVFIRAGLYSNGIRFLPPLSIPEDQLREALGVLEKALAKIQSQQG